MSCAAIPYITSLKLSTKPPNPRRLGICDCSSGIFHSLIEPVLQSMQVELVIVCKFALSQDPAFPGRNVRDDKGKQAQGVIGRDDRKTEHVAEGHGDEQGLHAAAYFDGVLFELVAEHPVKKLAHRLEETMSTQAHCLAMHCSKLIITIISS